MNQIIPHPAGLFSGRMMAKLSGADWAAASAVAKPSRRPTVALLVGSNAALLALLAWAVLPKAQPEAPAFPAPAIVVPDATRDGAVSPIPIPELAAGIQQPLPVAPVLPAPPSAPQAQTPALDPHADLPEFPAPLISTAPVVATAVEAPEQAVPAPAAEPRTTDIRVMTTGYCPCELCCGGTADGITAINRDVRRHPRGIAVDPTLIPYRTTLTIPGYGTALVDDTGGAMRQDGARGIVHLDLRFRTHGEAKRWGVQWLQIAMPDHAPAA
ncbi:MAG: 3D domain-containing protein, partial [Planctomycetes bacterium]|nr:3D domain-containing protein [Planctomycetota bacterium]